MPGDHHHSLSQKPGNDLHDFVFELIRTKKQSAVVLGKAPAGEAYRDAAFFPFVTVQLKDDHEVIEL